MLKLSTGRQRNKEVRNQNQVSRRESEIESIELTELARARLMSSTCDDSDEIMCVSHVSVGIFSYFFQK